MLYIWHFNISNCNIPFIRGTTLCLLLYIMLILTLFIHRIQCDEANTADNPVCIQTTLDDKETNTEFVEAQVKQVKTHFLLCIPLEPLDLTSQSMCHAHLLFICIVYSNFHVDDLKTVVKELDKKRQRKDELSPVFAMSPWYVNSGEYRLLNCWHRNARCKTLNDDHYILCIVVCTCNACSPPPPT